MTPCSIEATLLHKAQRSPPNENPRTRRSADRGIRQEEEDASEENWPKEKKFEGRPLLINKFAIEQLLKNRADLIKAEPSPTPASPTPRPNPGSVSSPAARQDAATTRAKR